MDYFIRNIFAKARFELYSERRNRTFRFIKYNGHNYSEIVSYIHELSPNTNIWPEEQLKVGVLYNYNRNSHYMSYVDVIGLRATIVNNPFLVLEDGTHIALALNKEEATEYLHQSKNHAVFHPKKPLDTFFYNKEEAKILVFNNEHPKGLDFAELPNDVEFYICDDKLTKVPYYKSVFNEYIHDLIIEPQLEWFVSKFDELKFRINEVYRTLKGVCFFEPSWNYWSKNKTLTAKCHNASQIHSMVKILYADIKSAEKNLADIKQADHEYINSLEILKDFDPSVDAEISPVIQGVIDRYTPDGEYPVCANDFNKFQIEIYSAYTSFLHYIQKMVIKPKEGIIREDDDGNIYCSRTLLPKVYAEYVGYKCCFSKYVINASESKYPYFCKVVDYICVGIQGEVNQGEKGKVLGKYKFPPHFCVKIGQQLSIIKIKPIFYRNSPYKGEVIEYQELESQHSPMFAYLMVADQDKQRFLDFLHQYLNDLTNKQAATFFWAGIDAGKILNPTYSEFNKEFPNRINSYQTYNKFGSLGEKVREKAPGYPALVDMFKEWH